ncbi:hypothetical protein FE257_007337 [Aspergillus nanangensis]|uniref:Arrestin-like N-terminal domain-containing protein n=1 Tax=Aspergillus nanangensis TaxID=2582783 RepID=A0AAD4GU97_ASPNN|nr:hypothetical protein FE257_007337 [Aspergillus nanangensis]
MHLGKRFRIKKRTNLGQDVTISIIIKDYDPARFYTTDDVIFGDAVITTRHAMHYKNLQVSFDAQDEHTSFSEICFLEAYATHIVPFTLIIPRSLPPQTCNHDIHNPLVHYAHTALPPSLGEPIGIGVPMQSIDCMAPRHVRISYYIQASFMEIHKSTRESPVSAVKNVTVMPASKMARPPPPFSPKPPPDSGDDYCLDTEKVTIFGKHPSLANTPYRVLQNSPTRESLRGVYQNFAARNVQTCQRPMEATTS